MKDADFSVCPFIKNELCYLTYFDFCKNAKILKWFYENMDDDAKIFYKWYVYANIHMEECFKNYIWEYLNSGEPEYYDFLMDQQSKYKIR